MLLYSYDIVFQEVPDETTLALNIPDCPYHCPGCHSPHLWGVQGEPITLGMLDRLVKQYEGQITCVCFMGGDKDQYALVAYADYIRKRHGLKVAWYSGRDAAVHELGLMAESFDYIKLGHYDADSGPLTSPTTNQRMWHRIAKGRWVDITHRFQKAV